MAKKKNTPEAEGATATATAEEEHAHEHDHEHEHDEEAFEFVEEPSFEVDYKGDCAYEVKTKIAAANIAKQSETMYDELKKDAELPGFRRGRAPRKLVEKKFAKVVKSDAEARVVAAAYQKLLKDEDLKAIGYPDIDGLDDLKERKEDDALEVTLKFEVAPRVELGKYRGVEVERPFVTVDDKDVDEQISEMLERQATFEPMEKGKAKEGDQVVIDFVGTIEGEAFEGGSAENYPYILGTHRFFQEFEDALKGAKPGADLETDVTFPDEYPQENLRGKTAHFTIKVHEVKRRKTPKLTDELAKDMGFEGAEDLRAKVKERLENASKNQSQSIAESRALQQVIETSSFEVPKSILSRLTEDMKEEEVRHRMSHRQPMKQIQDDMEKIEENARQAALRDIQTLLVLNEIGEAEGVEVTDEDYEAEISREAQGMAQMYGLQTEMVAQYLAQEGDRGKYHDRIFRTKALKVVMENAKVTDKELTREEMDEAETAAEEK